MPVDIECTYIWMGGQLPHYGWNSSNCSTITWPDLPSVELLESIIKVLVDIKHGSVRKEDWK